MKQAMEDFAVALKKAVSTEARPDIPKERRPDGAGLDLTEVEILTRIWAQRQIVREAALGGSVHRLADAVGYLIDFTEKLAREHVRLRKAAGADRGKGHP
jgi:hypothetical protein